jgi:hypothetical protein
MIFIIYFFFSEQERVGKALMRTKMIYTNRIEILNCEIQILALVCT